MKKCLVAAAFSIFFTCFAKADLAKRIRPIINQASQKDVQFSVHIVKAESGKTVYEHNHHRTLIPASNMKLIVAAAALKYLGPDYEYKTRVGTDGNSLLIIGSGDPLLADKATDDKYERQTGWIFKDIIAQLKADKLTAIKDIVVDSSIFDDERVHPNWAKDELNRWYACEVGGLNYNGNCIEIKAEISGGQVIIITEPKTSYVQITNNVTPISKGKSVIGSYRQGEQNKIIVHGKCKKQAGPFDVAIERPAAFFGYLLAEHLNEAGIKTKGQLVERAIGQVDKLNIIAEYNTSIKDCLARCNKNSFGLAAEALLKTIDAENKPGDKNGTWAGGCKLISEYLLQLGIDKTEFNIDDGSGLSRKNKLSANAITKVLLDAYRSRNWNFYKDSLSAGGIDGTIAKYFKEEKYKGKVLGKTGYIDAVKSFSGLCTTEAGDYIFSILANNANGQTRKALNNIAKAVIDEFRSDS
ncbi:MAG: D-alanyl-D-alanine carboxypeptidase/D-alanyl-D-alanine-endopeptidase [Sedimentisphaerales bacterium]|nr:D-alanyl-D-alanine carboxypeptidase/D-alanyl-D-alanine-endopeptidase [Sedimentisphaerales bacterium]